MDREQNLIETVREILNELPKDEVKTHLCIGRQDANGL
jgi:hypothetical protein